MFQKVLRSYIIEKLKSFLKGGEMSFWGPPNIEQLKKNKNIAGLNRALRNKDPNVVREASFALAELHQYSLLGLLLGISDSNWEIRRKTYSLYAGFLYYGFIPLVASIFDPHEMVRLTGLTALLIRNEERALDLIGGCLLNDPSPNVRLGSISTLIKINKEEAIKYLIKARNDPDLNVRKSILEQLNDMNFPKNNNQVDNKNSDIKNHDRFSIYELWKQLSKVISINIEVNKSKYTTYTSPIVNSCLYWMELAGDAIKFNDINTAYKYLWNISRVTQDAIDSQEKYKLNKLNGILSLPFYEYNQASNILINSVLLENEKVPWKIINNYKKM